MSSIMRLTIFWAAGSIARLAAEQPNLPAALDKLDKASTIEELNEVAASLSEISAVQAQRAGADIDDEGRGRRMPARSQKGSLMRSEHMGAGSLEPFAAGLSEMMVGESGPGAPPAKADKDKDKSKNKDKDKEETKTSKVSAMMSTSSGQEPTSKPPGKEAAAAAGEAVESDVTAEPAAEEATTASTVPPETAASTETAAPAETTSAATEKASTSAAPEPTTEAPTSAEAAINSTVGDIGAAANATAEVVEEASGEKHNWSNLCVGALIAAGLTVAVFYSLCGSPGGSAPAEDAPAEGGEAAPAAEGEAAS